MKKKNPAFASLAFVVLALTSCSGSDPVATPSTPSVEPATKEVETAKPEPTRSTRGNIIKQIGEPAGVRLEEGSNDWALSFTVTNVEVDPACTSTYPSESVNGHVLALTIEAATAPEPEFGNSGMTGVSFHPFHWKGFAPNGTTVNTVYSSAADNCMSEMEKMPTDIGAGEKVVGKVLLDVPDTTGTVAYSWGGTTGWEWEYGTK